MTEKFPLHVVCNWIGNSAVIAAKHYLQVTDAHFVQATQATGGAAQGLVSQVGGGSAEGGAKCGALQRQKVAQKAAQHLAAPKRIRSENTKKARKTRAKVQTCATGCATVQINIIPRRGVEPLSPP